ncbi:hypothetical protein CCR75_004881 [Bremia lactucae]|uniref:Transmembrane protein 242 n=1 Tax=Bremia lactucae TaxID=4779 RepID=A0A976II95_BRELC|nr:hypothetical protein CCR75_004881 [Bremia lactucae]
MKSADEADIAKQPAVKVVSTVVSIVAAAFLSGGFYYGMTKQKKALEEEEKTLDKLLSTKKSIEPKKLSRLEQKVALEQYLKPTTAAWKALLGVTLVSITGCCVLVGGATAAIGVTNMTDLLQRLQQSSKQASLQLEVKKLRESKGEAIGIFAENEIKANRK